MAQIKISEMPTASTVNLTDYVPIVQEGINKKTSVQNFVGNEAERIEAEKKRVEAEEARVAAERSRVQFEEIRKRDEETRAQNEENRTSAEEARVQAEESRVSSEEARKQAEQNRVKGENSRNSQEETRQEQEASRVEKEEFRATAEEGRVLAEEKRETQEQTRQSNEEARVSAESTRASQEETRQEQESARVQAEQERVNSESVRATTEQARVTAEERRVTAENTRVSNENERIKNENTRKQNEEERIKNEEDRYYNGLYVSGETYSGVASNKGIKLHSVKGKTSQKTTKGYQLFDSSKISTKTQGGATLTNNNDGSITISGSGNLTENFSLNYYYSKEESQKLLKAGTFTVNGLGNVSPNLIIGLRNRISGTFLDGKSVHVSRTSITLTEEDIASISDDIVFSFSFYTSQGTAIQSGTIKPMLYQDGDGTWEQYTGGKPAPNNDYAMEIQNVKISKIESVGKNLLEDSGYSYSQEYKYINSNSKIPSIFKSLKPDTTYTAFIYGELNLENGMFRICDINAKNDNSNYGVNISNKKVVFKTPSVLNPTDQNVVYIGLNLSEVSSAKLSNLKIMIVEGDHSSESPDYQDFQGYNTVETSLTLAQDDIYQNGTITRARKQVVLDGSSDEGWKNLVANTRVQCQLDTVIRANHSVNGYCNRAVYRKTGNANELENNEFTIISSNDFGGTRLVIRIPGDISTLEEWKTWLSTHNLVVEYELATPTTEEFKVPTIPSYYPYTNVSTDNDLTTDIEWELLGNSDNSLEIESLEKRIAALEKQLIGG